MDFDAPPPLDPTAPQQQQLAEAAAAAARAAAAAQAVAEVYAASDHAGQETTACKAA